jgi:hypothetical protein
VRIGSPRNSLVSQAFACAIAMLWLGSLPAQEPSGTKASPPDKVPDILPPGLRPDIIYLRNEKGEEVLVPRTSYEEYERLLNQGTADARDPQPPIGLSQLDVVIEPDKDFAKIALKAIANFGKPNKTSQTIPIALGQLQWLPTVTAAPNATAAPGETESVPDSPPHGVTAEDADSPAIDGLESISVAPQSNGYLWRVSPGSEVTRTLELQALSKLTSSSGGYSIRLDLPPAATAIRLKLPVGDWELTASGGGNEVIEPFQTSDDRSVAIIRTTASTVTLSWNRKTEKDSIAAIEVTSQTQFAPSADGTLVRAVTNLAIRGPRKLGGKRFLITLPPGTIVRESTNLAIGFPAYRIVRSNSETDADASGTAATGPVELSLEFEEALARSEIEIPIEWQLNQPTSASSLQFLVPELDGVQRHTGSFECIVPRNVTFEWKPVGETQLVRQSQSNDGSDSMAYVFQFIKQPAGVQCQWTSVASRPRLLSKQTLEVKDRRLQLSGSIEFLSDPFQLPLLQLEMTGWQVERILMRPTDIEIESSAVPATQDGAGRVSIPINSSLWLGNPGERSAGASEPSRAGSEASDAAVPNPIEPASNLGLPPGTDPENARRLKLNYVLSKSIEATAETFQFELPQLSWLSQETQQRSSKTIPGTLTLVSWPFRLQTLDEGQAGWITTPAPASLTPTLDGLREPGFSPFLLSYQILESAQNASWTGTRHRRASSTSAVYDASASISDDAIAIQHRWNCVSYGNRPTTLRLGIPKTLAPNTADDEPISPLAAIESFKIDAQSVTIEPIAPASLSPQPAVDNEMDWFRVSMPVFAEDGTYRTRFLVELSTKSHLAWNTSLPAAIDQPLPVLIHDTEADLLVIEAAQLSVTHAPGLFYQSAAPIETIASTSPGGTTTTATPQSNASSILTLDPVSPRWYGLLTQSGTSLRRSIRIEAEWIQTILNAIYQRDRYVVRFDCDEETVDIEVPVTVRKDAEWILNGQRANVSEIPDRPTHLRLTLREPSLLPTAPESQSTHVLEIFTLKASQGGWLRKIALTTPRLLPGESASPLVWQIIVPRTEHLLCSSEQLTPLYRWRWTDLFFARTSEYSQEQLERTLGATTQSVVTQQTNQYDLTSMTGANSLETWFIPSSLIWLPTALLVLLISALMTEKRWLRWPFAWILLMAAVILFSQWAWDISVIAAQSVVVAISVAIAYGLLRWLLDRRARRRSIFVSRSTSVATSQASRSNANSGSNLSIGDGAAKNSGTLSAVGDGS